MLCRWKGTAWTLRNTKCVVLVLLLALLRPSILKRSAAWQAGLLRHSWGVGSLSWGKRLKLLRGSWLLDGGAGEGPCDVKDLQWILFYSPCEQNWDQSEIHFSAEGEKNPKSSFMGKSDLQPFVGVQFWISSLGSGSWASWHPLEPGICMASFVFPVFNRTAKQKSFGCLLTVAIFFLIFDYQKFGKRITNNYKVSI